MKIFLKNNLSGPIFALALLAASSVSAADKPKITFDGVAYELAFSQLNQKMDMQEYIPAGQTLDTWTKFNAFYIYHGQEHSVKEHAAKFAQLIKLQNAQADVNMVVNDASGEAIVDYISWPKDKEFLEFHIFKFKSGAVKGDIMAYQFAARSYGAGEPSKEFTGIVNGRARLIGVMAKAAYPGITEAPADL